MIHCTVKDKRRSSIDQGGLEMPCELTFSIPNRTKDNKLKYLNLENC